MDFLKDLGPFILAVVAVIINGVPQLLYAQARGFALKPAGFAYLIGGLGNLLTGSVTPISSQAETITVASVKKNLRDNVSSILLAAVLMIIIAAFGGISKISDFAGVAIISGMMSGVGLMLAGVSLDIPARQAYRWFHYHSYCCIRCFHNSPNGRTDDFLLGCDIHC